MLAGISLETKPPRTTKKTKTRATIRTAIIMKIVTCPFLFAAMLFLMFFPSLCSFSYQLNYLCIKVFLCTLLEFFPKLFVLYEKKILFHPHLCYRLKNS